MKIETKALSLGAINQKQIDSLVNKISAAGIDESAYRINYFNINSEIVAKTKVIEKIKKIIG